MVVHPPVRHRAGAFAAASVVLLFVVALRLAWLSDDAFISFRASVNLVNGYGLMNNPGERVQAFTNPLWTLLVAGAYALFRDIYHVAIGLGLLCTLGAGLVLATRRNVGYAIALAPLLLALSDSFGSFSTSGLENALSHLLLAAFCVERLRPVPSRLRTWLWAGLLACNRLDHLLLVTPALGWELFKAIRTRELRARLLPALSGLSPLFLWLAWATFYYGFPLPNTAYAKLNLTLPRSTMVAQGCAYLVDSALREPLVLSVIALGVVLAWRGRQRNPAAPWLAAGAVLYVAYVVYIGGDFMSGRFFTAPYLIGAVLVAEEIAREGEVFVAAVAAAALLLGHDTFAPLPTDFKTHCPVSGTGIVDERACYVEHTGLVHNLVHKKYKTHGTYLVGNELLATGGTIINNLVGMAAFNAGPTVKVLDEFALSDPLLARIQFDARSPWRIGHFRRPPPAGYVETLREGRNRIVDPCVHRLWDDLQLVTHGPLFSWARFAKMAEMNLQGATCPPPPGEPPPTQ